MVPPTHAVDHPGTARCPEPRYPHEGLPRTPWPLTPCLRALPLLHSSYGLMRQTTTLHRNFVHHTYIQWSLQVAASPCWEMALPGVLSANLSPHAWPSTPVRPLVHIPVSSQETSAFTASGSARQRTTIHTATSVRGAFRSYQSFAHVQAGGFARHPGRSYRRVTTGQPWLFRPSRTSVVTFIGIGYAHRPNRVIDGVGTYTPRDSRPCRPLPRGPGTRKPLRLSCNPS
jgi:hypothetical protein